MTRCKLHPDRLPTNFERHEYIGALNCAIGGMVAQQAQSTDESEIHSWGREIAILKQIVESIRAGEYRFEQEPLD